MKKDNDYFKYLPSLIAVILLLVHFLLFVKQDNCNLTNNGFAFGILNSEDKSMLSIISLFVVFIIISLYFLIEEHVQKSLLIGVLLLSLGNLVDRFTEGICDYIEISYFPIFNLLDFGIVAGICLIFIDIMKKIWKR